jgi:hypothetical protein
MIANVTAEEASKTGYQIGLLKQHRADALSAPSCVNKVLRRICFEAGPCSKITPTSRQFEGFMDFGAGFVEPYSCPWLNSLGVDLGDPATWGICSKILAQYPRLSELCVTGHIAQNYESFLASKLIGRMKAFQRSTLIFRNARFTSTSCRVLLKISKQPSITTLIFDRSVLRFWDDFVYSQCPLLPNLKKVKYVGTFDPLYKEKTAENFCRT